MEHRSSHLDMEREWKKKGKDYPKQDLDYTHMTYLPSTLRWMALRGINSRFTKKLRDATPAVPIVLVGSICDFNDTINREPCTFFSGTQGLVSLKQNSTTIALDSTNWLLTKNAWWFLGLELCTFHY